MTIPTTTGASGHKYFQKVTKVTSLRICHLEKDNEKKKKRIKKKNKKRF